MPRISLVVMDMAGTTVTDRHEVEQCFAEAARQTGLFVSDERVLAMQGLAKRYVFETLWAEQLGDDNADIPARNLANCVETSYRAFTQILENHYLIHGATPTEGCVETLTWLRDQGIAVALTTGFYRKVTDIILEKLGWLNGLALLPDGGRLNTDPNALIRVSLASDEVERGRPYPFLIEQAMQLLNVENARLVVNVGDTPSDLLSARAAGCRLNVGLTNGTHSREQLDPHPHDVLLDSLADLPALIASLPDEDADSQVVGVHRVLN
jgi:phosphonatase-like hydrolase